MAQQDIFQVSRVPASVSTHALSVNNPEAVVAFRGVKGKTVFVDSNVDGDSGTSWDDAVGTIDEAVPMAGADGLILVAPGHVETVTAAAGIVFDAAGQTVIGMGNGNRRPQINFTTATSADVDIDAASVTLVNLRFTGGIDALAGPIDINAADCALVNIVTEDVTGQTTDFIVTDANADRLLIDGWEHRGAAADGGDSAISIVGGDDIEIRNFKIYGNFDQGAIENVSTAAVRIWVHDGYIFTDAAEDLAVVLDSSTTGAVGPRVYARLQDDAQNITESFVGAAAHFFAPIEIVNADAETSIEYNATESTDAIV